MAVREGDAKGESINAGGGMSATRDDRIVVCPWPPRSTWGLHRMENFRMALQFPVRPIREKYSFSVCSELG